MRCRNILRIAIISMAVVRLFTVCPEPKPLKYLKTSPKKDSHPEPAEKEDAEKEDSKSAEKDAPQPAETVGKDKEAEKKDAPETVGRDKETEKKDAQETVGKDKETEKKDAPETVGRDKEAEKKDAEKKDATPDTTPPTIIGVPDITSTPKSSGTYKIGETILIAVMFSEIVNVDTNENNKHIYIHLQIGAKGVRALYDSGSDSTKILFTYTVRSGDKASRGINIRKDVLTITRESGASIKDKAGNLAKLNHKSMKRQANHKVDAEPTITEVNMNFKDGTYIVGGHIKVIEVAITFSEIVKVDTNRTNKNIYVKLRINATPVQAIYQSGSSKKILRFEYPVKKSNTSPTDIHIPKNALTIKHGSGASIKDKGGNNAKLEHAPLENN